MVTVNSVNECPYCTLLHTEGAASAAGVDGTALQAATTAAEAREKSFDDAAITFAYVFGETGGFGAEKDAAYQVLVEAKGRGHAKSVHALCRYMTWGGKTGNTIQGFLCGTLICNPRPGQSMAFVPLRMLFELLVVVWYSFLFLMAIPVVGKILGCLPKMPNLVNGIIGAVLVSCASE